MERHARPWTTSAGSAFKVRETSASPSLQNSQTSVSKKDASSLRFAVMNVLRSCGVMRRSDKSAVFWAKYTASREK